MLSLAFCRPSLPPRPTQVVADIKSRFYCFGGFSTLCQTQAGNMHFLQMQREAHDPQSLPNWLHTAVKEHEQYTVIFAHAVCLPPIFLPRSTSLAFSLAHLAVTWIQCASDASTIASKACLSAAESFIRQVPAGWGLDFEKQLLLEQSSNIGVQNLRFFPWFLSR